MSLSATSIRRPVLSIVFSLIIIIFGIVAFTFLEVREYPSVDPPIVTVTTGYPGANSEVIETQITEPLEESLNGIDGIKSLTSQSREGQSQITIEFSLERNLEDASNDVRDRVSRALRNLPTDVDPPVVQKSDADDSPIIFMYVQSNTRNILEVNAFATNVIKERIQTIPGVSTVRIFGERKYAMRMWLDPEKLAAYQLTPLDVRTALEKENVELPSGRIEGDKTELTIRTLGRLKDAEEFNNLIVRETNGTVIRFKDVGYAELGPENERGSLKRAGLLGVGVAVTMQPGGNAIDISDEFKKRYEQLKKDIPADYSIEIGFDFSEYIRTTISEVEETIFIAFGLVILIIFLFLRDWRSTLIPIVAIPTSIISAFFIMYLMGYSINVLTLVGMILAIGLVVDDAIVVLENIYSKIEEGMNPIEAAYKGSKEIYFAVISITIALVAVFLPIMFIEGTTGKLFKEFAVVIAGSVLVSAFVALTLTPMMSSRLLKANAKHNKFYSLTEPFFVKTIDTYRKMLIGFMKIRWAAFIIIAIVGVLIYMTGSSLKSELAPLEDRSNIRIQATAPEGATFEYMQKYMDDLSDVVITSTPEIQTPITNVGAGGQVNNGFINMYLVPPGERERTQQQIYDKLAKEINQISGIRAFPSQPPTIGGRFGGQPIQFVLQAPEYEKLEEFMPKFLEEANKQPELTFVDANLKINKPEINLTIDRQKASDLGVSFSDVASTLQISFGSQRFGYFIKEGKQYQVLGQVTRDKRDNPYDLRYLYVRNKNNQLIQLDNLVSLTEQAAPTTRYRYNRYSSATISGGLAPGYTLGDGIAAMRRVAAEVLPEEFNTALAGQSKDFEESSSSLLFTFVFALIIIYLVLAAQFESFIDPFIILLTVPLALFGALLSLWVFGMTLNIFSQIGIIMLIGLVTKNAILIVEFANQKKEEGLSVKEAVDEAAVQRFRPIMMTSIASALGALPIAIGIGAGSRVSLGIAIVGGLIFSTFLTLFIVPAI
ncbi:MAG TPA: efflux RND transporter permease subunit, partial [Ignavibacteria bacterium]|nr:efflux RND transporter permease subunit [Ignavibacteria bacterium]HRJ86739.1 efflux RND transporter permease subunit [Ignavibacteria bacterium]